MRILGTMLVAAAIAAPTHGRSAEALPPSGGAKLAAYQYCHALAVVEMGEAGVEGATECNGVVRNLDPQKAPDNLGIRCLEDTSVRPKGYKYAGACVLTDDDGDKLFMTYDEQNGGAVKWIGGVGKYKDIIGGGALHVVVAPGNTATQFAHTLTFDVTWAPKPK